MTNGERELMNVLREAVQDASGGGPSDAARTGKAIEGLLREIGTQGSADGRSRVEGLLGSGGVIGGFRTGGGLLEGLGGGSGLGSAITRVNPLIGGLLGLFGGGGEREALVLPKADRPASENYEAGFAGPRGRIVQVDRDASGQERPIEQRTAPSIVVNVEAMDSRSFLERTPEIAEAVRRAFLESEGLGGMLSGWQG